MSLVILEDITELVVLRQQIKKLDSLDSFIGNDPKIIQLRGKIKVLADVDMPVFIEGESGTGKELIAVAIHKQGTRASKPFVPVNCGALPEALLESELFGHVKGAFTGAMRDKKGRFEMADGGTIFLDEVGDISPAMQVKLLRVLQESTFEPVGGEKTIKVNVRIISATNKDIKKEIEQRRFREDLYYRLCVIPLTIPPLRQRKEDIVILAAHILKESMLSINKAAAKFSPEAIDSLLNYLWPGNVRELQNAIQYALVNCRNNIILPADFPPSITNFHLQNQTQQKRTRRKKLNAYDVKNVLIETKGNKVDAAKKLGVGRATLYRFLEAEEFG
jgi:transcriptional regulator with PAS, ATPase and Fis domain